MLGEGDVVTLYSGLQVCCGSFLSLGTFGKTVNSMSRIVNLKKEKNTGESVRTLFQDRYQSEGNIAECTKQCMHYQFFLPNHFLE